MNISKKDIHTVSIDWRKIKSREFYLLETRYQIMIALMIGMIVFLFLGWLILFPVLSELLAQRAEEKNLKNTYILNVNRLASLPILIREIENIQKSSAKLLSQLPNHFSTADIVQEFYEAGSKNGLLINVNQNLKTKNLDSLAIQPYEIETSGTYVQLENFCLALSKLNVLVILSDFRLSINENLSHQTGKEILDLKVIANTYHAKK